VTQRGGVQLRRGKFNRRVIGFGSSEFLDFTDMQCHAVLQSIIKRLACGAGTVQVLGVKLFYTGPVINTEMLVTMLEKHGIAATQEFEDPSLPDDGDLNRLAKVLVPEDEYDRAHRLFYAEREDEL
jgi:hypothetical protein